MLTRNTETRISNYSYYILCCFQLNSREIYLQQKNKVVNKSESTGTLLLASPNSCRQGSFGGRGKSIENYVRSTCGDCSGNKSVQQTSLSKPKTQVSKRFVWGDCSRHSPNGISSSCPLPRLLTWGRILNQMSHTQRHTSLSHCSSIICSYEVFCLPQGIHSVGKDCLPFRHFPLQKQVTRRGQTEWTKEQGQHGQTETGAQTKAPVNQQRAGVSSSTLPPRNLYTVPYVGLKQLRKSSA